MEPFGRNCSVFTEKRRTRYIPQSGLCVSYAPLRNYFTSGFESSAVPTAICVGEDLAYSEFQPTEQAAAGLGWLLTQAVSSRLCVTEASRMGAVPQGT